MPLYEYRCEKCGKVKEVLVSGFGRDEVDERCACGGRLKRIFSTTADIRSSAASGASAGECTPST